MDFVAIDFETATSKRTSACSVGVCEVQNDEIVIRDSFLIKPEPFKFDEYNTMIHGITPDRVIDELTFDEMWCDLWPYINGKTVVAHNADFDISVLLSTLDFYEIPYPTFDYLCTVKLSQKAYPNLLHIS